MVFRIKRCASPINVTNADDPAGCQKRPKLPQRIDWSRECASGRVFRPRDLAGKSFRNDGEAYPFGSYCAGAVAGLAAAAALCGFFFGLSVAGLVSNPGGGLAASGEDDVGVQWTAGLVLPSFAFAFVPFASGAFAPVAEIAVWRWPVPFAATELRGVCS